MAHVLVIVSRRFNPGELWDSLRVFKKRGHTFDVVSSSKVITSENKLKPIKIQTIVPDIASLEGYDGLVFVSGNPKDTEWYWTNPDSLRLVQEASQRDLMIGAICASVPSIRSATVGKKVTFYPLSRIRELMTQAGAICHSASLCVDGKIVTAENEVMTVMWAVNMCDVLEGKDPTYVMSQSSFQFKTIPRKPIPELEHLKEVKRRTGKAGLKE